MTGSPFGREPVPEGGHLAGRISLRETLVRHIEGGATGVVVEGFPGTGRTSLVLAVAHRARTLLGVRVRVLDDVERPEAAEFVLEQLEHAVAKARAEVVVAAGAVGSFTTPFAERGQVAGLAEPVELQPLEFKDLQLIFERRVEACQGTGDVFLPLLRDSFVHLCKVLRGDLKTALRWAEAYCCSMAHRPPIHSVDAKNRAYVKWLDGRAAEVQARLDRVDEASRLLLLRLLHLGGAASWHDGEVLGFRRLTELESCIEQLVAQELVASTPHHPSRRCKTLLVEPEAWLLVPYRAADEPGDSF